MREANRFIEKHHRHSGRVQGCKFCVALSDGLGVIHGVAVAGRPISRYLDDGRTAEVTRLCTDGTFNGCSFLYGCCARIAREMGFRKIITYTLAEESGATGDGDGYWVDEGWYDFFRDNYSASMTATTRIEPDEKVPTAAGNTMKSGYGVSNTVTATVSTSAPMSHYTYGQTVVSYFPEFNYTTYWRLLDRLSSGRTARFQFTENIYSTYKQRVHFSPVWFPDGSYTVNTHVMDIWTPAGMLCANLTDSVTISGSLYDDWHIAPGNP